MIHPTFKESPESNKVEPFCNRFVDSRTLRRMGRPRLAAVDRLVRHVLDRVAKVVKPRTAGDRQARSHKHDWPPTSTSADSFLLPVFRFSLLNRLKRSSHLLNGHLLGRLL